jgi:hypothetical protein
LVAPKFPWSDPLVIQIPQPTRCEYTLKQADGSADTLTGTGTSLETVPAGGYAFEGTSLDLVKAALLPVPSGIQDLKVTCTGFTAQRSVRKTATAASP